jgi:periplasmic protein TonB
MRIYTLALSIIAHVIGVLAVVVATLVATDVLPEPRRATEFIEVAAIVPRAVPPPPAAAPRIDAPRPDLAPIIAPEGIRPEPPIDPGINPNAPVDDLDPPPPQPPPPPVHIVHVGGDIRPPQKVNDVPPVYPAIARAARVEGLVILEALIGEDGVVRDVRVLRSVQLLDAAAVDAVRQWRFTPTLLNGQPVPVVMTVTVTFKLR